TGGSVEAGVAKRRDLLCPPDGRELDSGRAGLEQAVDERAVELVQADERGEAERRRVTDEPERVRLGELRVLEVDDREVELCSGDLDHLERGQLHERAGEPPRAQRLADA